MDKGRIKGQGSLMILRLCAHLADLARCFKSMFIHNTGMRSICATTQASTLEHREEGVAIRNERVLRRGSNGASRSGYTVVK
eukprot:8445656-Pyramimonas_sp.AAC.1